MVLYQLWRVSPDVPFDLHGDARFNLMTVRNMVERGWFQRTPRLGAPFGLDLHDFPLGGDHLQFVLLRLFALTGASAAAVMNAYLVATFVLVAVTAGFVLRWLGLSEPVAAVFATAYTFLPYHFYRGEHHLFLSGYWAVPLAAYLALSIAQERSLFQTRRATLLTLAVCGVIGSTDPYYTAYAVLLVVVAAGAAALRTWQLRAAAPAVALTVAIAAVLALNLAPSFLYRQRHGPDPKVAVRFPVESEIYGLKLTKLVLPRPDHRLPGLGNLAERYSAESPIPSEGGQTLGLVGSAGLVWLLLFAAAGRLGVPFALRRRDLHANLSVLTIVCLLIGTVGGGSMLIAYFVTPQFRSWARISVVIAFLALAAVAQLVDSWRADRRGAPGNSAVLVAILLLALLDQSSRADVPRYSANAAEFASDHTFVTSIERLLPPSAMVFQLPLVSFPEAPRPGRMNDYDHLVGYLHSRHLRWSYGGMKGREADWQQALAGQPTALFLERLAAVGFTGLTIDRFGYDDGAARLEEEVGRLAGAPRVSSNGRLSFFDLTAYGAALHRDRPAASVDALAQATLQPVLWDSGPGFEPGMADGDSFWLTASEREGSLVIHNPSAAPRTIVLITTVESGGNGQLTIRLPSGATESAALPCGRTALRREIPVPPGTSALRFTADVPPVPAEDRPKPGGARFRLLSPSVWDSDISSANAGSAGPAPSC